MARGLGCFINAHLAQRTLNADLTGLSRSPFETPIPFPCNSSMHGDASPSVQPRRRGVTRWPDGPCLHAMQTQVRVPKPSSPVTPSTDIRPRKQKCGGFTYGIKCRPCTTRKVKCSFQEEVMDLRHNPYLRMTTPKSPSVRNERTSADNFCLSPASAALIPALAALDRGDGQASLSGATGTQPSPRDEDLPKQVQSLTSR